MEKQSRAVTLGAYGTDQGPINSRRATQMQPLQCRSAKRSRKYTMHGLCNTITWIVFFRFIFFSDAAPY